jgi:hypothetical protein
MAAALKRISIDMRIPSIFLRVRIPKIPIENKIELSDLEMSQLISRQHVNFRVFENAFYQFEQKLLETETWERYRFIIKDLLNNNEASKKMWINYANSFTDSFQNEVKHILNYDNSLIDDTSIISEDSIRKTK